MSIFVIPLLMMIQGAEIKNGYIGDGLYWEGSGWAVYKYNDEDTCDIGRPLPKEEYLTVQYHPKDKFSAIMLTNKYATSLTDRQKVKLDILFLKNNQIGAQYRSITFEAHKQKNGPVALISDTLEVAFLDEMAKSDAMGVFTSTRAVVGVVNLKGSSLAVEKLKSCAFEAAELNPQDPFLEE